MRDVHDTAEDPPELAPTEFLVASDHLRAEEVRRALERAGHITHFLPPRLFVVEPERSSASLLDIPGVIVVAGPTDEVSIPGANTNEALFVEAWVRRVRQSAPDARPHDGLAWDSPGMVPPDP